MKPTEELDELRAIDHHRCEMLEDWEAPTQFLPYQHLDFPHWSKDYSYTQVHAQASHKQCRRNKENSTCSNKNHKSLQYSIQGMHQDSQGNVVAFRTSQGSAVEKRSNSLLQRKGRSALHHGALDTDNLSIQIPRSKKPQKYRTQLPQTIHNGSELRRSKSYFFLFQPQDS